MGMTKRYLESLPKEKQDDILGLPFDGWDEWDESAENEASAKEELWWARMLAEEGGDEQC